MQGEFPVYGSNGQIGWTNEFNHSTGVIIGRVGANCGSVEICRGKFWASDNTIVVKPKNENNLTYWYYRLKSMPLRSYAGGAAQPLLTQGILKVIRTRIAHQSIQSAIASILSSYDDLIENNRRRIQLLEQAARLLYKEWFVHLRFPGHEHTKVINGVPEGWERKTLGDVLVNIESGGRPRGGSKEKGIPSIGAENVIGIGQYDYTKEKYISDEYFNSMGKGVVENRDVVVYKDGANIGRSSYFGEEFPHEKCAVNEHVFILRGLPELGQNLLYFWVAREETRHRIANLNANTAQPGVSQSKLKSLSFVQPHHAVASLYNENVDPTVRQIFILARENRKLIKARDLLLPKLMTGEVTV